MNLYDFPKSAKSNRISHLFVKYLPLIYTKYENDKQAGQKEAGRGRTEGGEEKKEGKKEGGRKGRRKEEKNILTYFWSLQTVLFRVVQEGRHIIIQF